MNLKPTFEKYYPEGSQGGQCAYFAEQLYAFGPVGDLYNQKYSYFISHGSANINDIQVGDVLLLHVGVYGHICIVNADMGDSWQLTESNWNVDEKVHHTRLLNKQDKNLKAHLRAQIKVPIINQESMRLINDKGTVYLVGDKAKIGISDEPFMNILKLIAPMETGDTSLIPQVRVLESLTKVDLVNSFQIKEK